MYEFMLHLPGIIISLIYSSSNIFKYSVLLSFNLIDLNSALGKYLIMKQVLNNLLKSIC